VSRNLANGHVLKHRSGFVTAKDSHWSAQSFSFFPGSNNAHVNALSNDFALQLCDRGQNCKHHPAGWAASVHAFVQADEVHAKTRKLFQRQDQVPSRPREPIEPGHEHHIEPPAPRVSHETVQLRPAILPPEMPTFFYSHDQVGRRSVTGT
jgi:hypothetical protein